MPSRLTWLIVLGCCIAMLSFERCGIAATSAPASQPVPTVTSLASAGSLEPPAQPAAQPVATMTPRGRP